MAAIEQEVLGALLSALRDQKLIDNLTYDKAKNIVNSTLDFPEFFEYCVCCQKEGETNGCTQD